MNSPLVSLVVPVFNVAEYIDECLLSLVSQTYKNLEIILVDDGSSDGSRAKCEEWVKQDGRVRAIYNNHAGASYTRNTGIANSRGEYIGFIDSDDFVSPDYIERLLKAQTDYPDCDISTCCIQKYIDGKVEPFSESWQFSGLRFIEPEDFAERLLLMKSQHSSCGKLFKRYILESVKYRNGVSNEDIMLYLDMYPFVEANNIRVVELPDTLYFYRMRAGSTCFGKNVNMVVAETINMETIMDTVKGSKPEIYDYYHKAYISNLMYLLNKSLNNEYVPMSRFSLWRKMSGFRDCFVKKEVPEIRFTKFLSYKYAFPIVSVVYGARNKF